ncbi:MAG: DUF3369 domain-containing protein [Helicobacteraceae bacterium]|jgi:DNA-binding NarL/FixJ family response regulator|nr:DUF3369 domain-containing protein [Helicobacteraceae bacterium]
MQQIEENGKKIAKPWKVLVVDPDNDAHVIARMTLQNIVFKGRKLEVMGAFNSIEARQMIAFHADLAVIFIDAMIEGFNYGYELVRFIRSDLKNEAVRLVMQSRDEQSLPETQAVLQYEINGYHKHANIANQQLFSIVITQLRAFCEMRSTLATKRGLEIIAGISRKMLYLDSIDGFFRASLEGLAQLVYIERAGYYMPLSAFAIAGEKANQSVVAGLGSFEQMKYKSPSEFAPPALLELIESANDSRAHKLESDYVVLVIDPIKYPPCFLAFVPMRDLNDWEKWTFTIYASNLSAIYRGLIASAP